MQHPILMNLKGSFRIKTFVVTPVFLLIAMAGMTQTDLKNWNSLNLDFSFSKKLDLRFSHLRSYDISNNYNNDFNQSSVRVDYNLTKHFSLSGGVVAGSLSTASGANRILIRATYKNRVADVLRWSNAIQVEAHSAQEKHYRNRVLYITSLGTKKRLPFLRLLPSVSYTLYYNIGGKPIQYYDKNDQPAILQTPDGFHRGRLSMNLNSKINKTLSLTMYYMMQREFNLFTDDYHKMNIVNPATGKIARPFNNYNVIGATLTVNLDLYNKHHRNASENQN